MDKNWKVYEIADAKRATVDYYLNEQYAIRSLRCQKLNSRGALYVGKRNFLCGPSRKNKAKSKWAKKQSLDKD